MNGNRGAWQVQVCARDGWSRVLGTQSRRKRTPPQGCMQGPSPVQEGAGWRGGAKGAQLGRPVPQREPSPTHLLTTRALRLGPASLKPPRGGARMGVQAQGCPTGAASLAGPGVWQGSVPGTGESGAGMRGWGGASVRSPPDGPVGPPRQSQEPPLAESNQDLATRCPASLPDPPSAPSLLSPLP